MNRELKNQQMRDAILQYACREFARRGYEAGSLNTICAEGGMSKGIIYHYFSSKKQLYLACVHECFDRLTNSLRGKLTGKESLTPEDYFAARAEFFMSHPDEAELFCQSVLYPPEGVLPEVQNERMAFDDFNTEVLHRILSGKKLRSDISEESMQQVFRQFQDFLNARYHQAVRENSEEVIKQHEKECLNAISIFLYGIVSR